LTTHLYSVVLKSFEAGFCQHKWRTTTKVNSGK